MPLYEYTVRDASGQVRTGTSEADDAEMLTFRLQQQGFDVEQIITAEWQTSVSRQSKLRVPGADVLVFWIQFSIMIDARVARWRALDVAAQQATSPALRQVLQDVANSVVGGTPLHSAMGKYPNVFSQASVGIVHAGEVANALPDAVHRLIQYIERDQQRSRRRSV